MTRGYHSILMILEKWYSYFHRFLLGESPTRLPPRWLWVLWIAIVLVRLPSFTYSLDEDSIWCLVTQIDRPWSVTLGLKDTYTLNHIVNSVLAKILIKGTCHHFVEFTYRIPSFVAGALAMPLGYAVMARMGGPISAAVFGAAVAFLPSINLHATTARGYMLLVFFTIWALGLTPGITGRIRPIRLGCAYFLLASSHGLGIINACCFVFAGCFTGFFRPGLKMLLANCLLAAPGLCFNIPMAMNMRAEGVKMAAPANWGLLDTAAFIPRWLEYQFGSTLAPGLSIIFLIVMITGVGKTFKRSIQAGISMIVLMCCIPVSYIMAKTYWSQEWYSMGCIVFWLWAFCAGVDAVYSYAHFNSKLEKRALVLSMLLLACLMLPHCYEYLRYPRQDYKGLFRTFVRQFPERRSISCIASMGITGLSYYARQNKLDLHSAPVKGRLPDSLWSRMLSEPAIILVKGRLSEEDEYRLSRHAYSNKDFKGTGWDLSLYFMKREPEKPGRRIGPLFFGSPNP